MSLIETDIFDNVEDLVANSIKLIKKHEPEDGYRVGYSGGKDSECVLALTKMAEVKYSAYMMLSSVDPPEVLKFVRKYHPEVELIKPKKSMFQLILEHKTPPTRKMPYCCQTFKELATIGRTVILGIRWEESSKRKRWKDYQSIKDRTDTFVVNPILRWSSDEVWQFIFKYNLPYSSLYKQAGGKYHRLGCIGCPKSGNNRNIDWLIWPQYKKAYFNTFNKLINLRNNIGMDNKGIFTTPEHLWSWWMEELPKEDKQQSVLEFK